MGIVNVTPDSFSDGGKYVSRQAAIDHALQLIEDGADILDVGGESTRPGAVAVPVDEEYERVIPVIEGIRKENADITISIDTMKTMVALAAIDAGANIINDVSASTYDRGMLEVAALKGVPIILMHMQGEPQTMQKAPTYSHVLNEVASFLQERSDSARNAGVPETFVDPGIGFGKTLDHNMELLRGLDRLAEIAPVVLGISRKRFLGEITGITDAADRDVPTALMHALLLTQNVAIVRVHNVAMLAQLRTLHDHLHG